MAVQRDKVITSAEKLVVKGKIEPAIKEYERLLEDNPNDVNTLNRIGDLWVRINRNDEAVKVFTRIADHYSKDGFFLKAIAIYKKINKLDPSKLDIYAKLADLYAKQGLAMEAKSQYQVLADYYSKQDNLPGAIGQIKAGRVRVLGVSSTTRHPSLPDVPTIAESGLPGFEVVVWYAVFVAGAPPPDVLARLVAASNRAVSSPEVQRRLSESGVDPGASSPGELAARARSEMAKWAKVVKDAGLPIQ